MSQILRRSMFAGCVLLLLTACGGGGGNGIASGGDDSNDGGAAQVPWPLSPATVRALIGGEVPAFSDRSVGQAVDGLTRSADSLLASDLLVFNSPGPPIRGETFCTAAECSSSFLATVLSLSFSGLGFRDPSIEYQAIATHRSVSLAQGRGKAEIAGTAFDHFGYGGWLEHSFFIVETDVINEGVLRGTAFGYSYSVGDATGTNPTIEGGTATWSGVMVGGDVSATAARGHHIQGDAKITIADLESPKVSIEFTNLYNLNVRSPLADITWRDIAVTNGGFESGLEGESIEGKFYGPNHEEVGGVFERDEILGAFGAMRIGPPVETSTP
jgi:hypothetical protein